MSATMSYCGEVWSCLKVCTTARYDCGPTTMPRLLLISNSTAHGRGYLDHVEGEIGDFVGSRTRLVFIPYALHDRRAYCVQAESRLSKMGLEFRSVHDVSNARHAIKQSEVIFIGGGN